VNLWYPAEKPEDLKPMRHRDYLAIQTGDLRVSRFAAKLVEYVRTIVCKEVMGKPVAALSDRERRLLDEFWDTPTACLRDAMPRDGKFPLVLYHSGAQSSFEDNAVLCEFLASHGFVVVGSAFQETGRSFNVDPYHTSLRDLEFLIAYARRLSYVDWEHIGLAGHSAGAQGALIFCSQDASPVDAVVSLDTTEDYHSVSDRRWEDMVKPILERAENIHTPFLMIANCHAFFDLMDRLKHADRYYLTFADVGHNDFISQGIVRHDLAARASPGDRNLQARRDAARAAYAPICESIVDFFDVHLKQDPGKKGRLLRYERNRLGGVEPHLDFVPAGVGAAEPLRDGSDAAPTPRQFRPLLAKRGLEPTIALLKQCHEKDPSAPIFQGEFGYALVFEMLETDRNPEAIAFTRLYASFGLPMIKLFIRTGDVFRGLGMKPTALDYYQKARVLEPDNAEVSERLRALRDAKKD
jgi:pimeloyl-ACP methyl ester carboxylesterase